MRAAAVGTTVVPANDYLVRRKLTSFLRDVPHFPMAKHTTRFLRCGRTSFGQ
ncbi:MAG: hypothetical protein ACRDQU_14305 [Pseudonocardiaceae bacterium]